MKIITEENLRHFEFWSGAVANANTLTEEELDQVEEYLEELFPDGLSAVAINDAFWFEFDTILERLGKSPEEE